MYNRLTQTGTNVVGNKSAARAFTWVIALLLIVEILTVEMLSMPVTFASNALSGKQSLHHKPFLQKGATLTAKTSTNAQVGKHEVGKDIEVTQSAEGGLPTYHQVLPNGHHVYVVEKRDQPIVTLDTWVKVGSSSETPSINGITHFLEHLIFKGTPSHKVGEFDRQVEQNGAILNAATSSDFTHFYLTLPKAFFSEALKLHADMLMNANIPKAELDRERPVVQEEINRATDNPQRQLYTRYMEKLFAGHGYGMDTLGPKALIGQIPRASILGYYQHWYRPQHFSTFIVGDVDAKQAINQVKTAFANVDPRALADKGHYTPPTKFPSLKPVEKASVSLDGLNTINTLYWTVGWQAPKAAKIEDVAALDAAMYALGGSGASRLYRALVQTEPLATQVSAYNMSLKQAGSLQVYAELKPENWDKVSEIITNQLHQLITTGVSEDELAAFKTTTFTDKQFEQESTHGLANIMGYFAVTSKVSDHERYLQAVKALTPEQVRRVVKHYITLDKPTVAAIAPSDQLKALEAKLHQWTKQLPNMSALASKGHDGVALNNPTKSGLAANGLGKTQATQNAIERITYPNGVRAILNPLPGSQTIAFGLYSRGGQAIEAKPGVAMLAASLLTKGTTNRSNSELHDYLEANGLSLSAQSQADMFTVSGAATASQWPALQTILTDVLANHSLTQAELDKAKTRLKAGILSDRDDLDARVTEVFTEALYPQHPYGAVGQRILEQLDTITLDDIKQYLQQSFAPERLVMVLSGQLPKQSQQTLSQLSGSLPYPGKSHASIIAGKSPAATPKSPLADDPTLPPILPAKPGLHEVTLPNAAATRIIQGYQAPALGSPQFAAAKVLAACLGNGLSSRLFVNLREKQSLAYSVYARLTPGMQASSFFLAGGTDPKNQQAIMTGFTKELTDLATTPLSADELKGVKDKLLGQFILGHETPAKQANFLGSYEAMGLGYTFDKRYPELIAAVTAEQVQAYARQLMRTEATFAIVRPEVHSRSKN
jgi:zinc protease